MSITQLGLGGAESSSMTPSEAVAAEVRAILARRRLTQAKLASVMDMGQMYLSRRLNGRIPFSIDELAAIAEVLDVPLSSIIPPRDGYGDVVQFVRSQSDQRIRHRTGDDEGAAPADSPSLVRHQGLEPRTRWLRSAPSQRPVQPASSVTYLDQVRAGLGATAAAAA